MFRILIPIVALLVVGKAMKRRRIVQYLSGKTPTEARALIVEKASDRTTDEKASAIADRVVAKLDAKGVLAPEPV